MTATRAFRRVAAVMVAAAALAAGGLLAWRHHEGRRGAAAPLPVRAAPDRLPDAVARLHWRPVVGDAPASIAGFAVAGDTVLALDPVGHRVVLLRLERDTVRVVGAWGRRGGGPGELRQPVALAAAGPREVAIVDAGGRVRRYDHGGRLVATDVERPACPTFAPTVAYGRDGRRWTAGHCAGAAGTRSSDTIFTVVHEAREVGPGHERAREPRMALDQSWGSAFATLRPLADLDTAVLLAPGIDGCVLRLDAPPGPGARRCGLVREHLRAPPPPTLVAERRAAEARGQARFARLLRWPDALPAWLAVATAPDALLLARPVSADSLLVVPADRPFDPAAARLVAPVRSLVTCARGTCLWYDGERLAVWRADGAPHLGGAP